MARQEGHGREDRHQPQQEGPGDGGYGQRLEVTTTKPNNPTQDGTNQSLSSGWGKEPTREQHGGTQQHDGRDPGAAAARTGAEGELRRDHGLQRDGGLQVHQRLLSKREPLLVLSTMALLLYQQHGKGRGKLHFSLN